MYLLNFVWSHKCGTREEKSNNNNQQKTCSGYPTFFTEHHRWNGYLRMAFVLSLSLHEHFISSYAWPIFRSKLKFIFLVKSGDSYKVKRLWLGPFSKPGKSLLFSVQRLLSSCFMWCLLLTWHGSFQSKVDLIQYVDVELRQPSQRMGEEGWDFQRDYINFQSYLI